MRKTRRNLLLDENEEEETESLKENGLRVLSESGMILQDMFTNFPCYIKIRNQWRQDVASAVTVCTMLIIYFCYAPIPGCEYSGGCNPIYLRCTTMFLIAIFPSSILLYAILLYA